MRRVLTSGLARAGGEFAAILALSFVMGCAIPAPRGSPPTLSQPQISHRLLERSARLRTLKDPDASLRLKWDLGRGEEGEVALGAVLLYDSGLPGLWLRAEKVGQKVFDLRAQGQKFWLEVPETREVITGSQRAWERVGYLVRLEELALLLGVTEGVGLNWPSTQMEIEPDTYRFKVFLEGFLVREVVVGKDPLAVFEIREYDLAGRTRAIYLMEDYNPVDGTLLPFEVRVERPMMGVSVGVGLDEPVANTAAPRAFFRPKRRPGLEHIDLNREPLREIRAFGGGSE